MKRSTSGRRKKKTRKRATTPPKTYPVVTPKGNIVRFVDGVDEDIKRRKKDRRASDNA